ncbi:basic proline-rich protein-like [Orycteropus afer afer]|uniref:Basic proline-rich protein-like n=1 Tax=Orycteropus afer afer TaxID=1230840 RepID=A0A8B6ZW76_ORYAF|nr:basic proline-rich protein-like [Orycteropus afer afer]
MLMLVLAVKSILTHGKPMCYTSRKLRFREIKSANVWKLLEPPRSKRRLRAGEAPALRWAGSKASRGRESLREQLEGPEARAIRPGRKATRMLVEEGGGGPGPESPPRPPAHSPAALRQAAAGTGPGALRAPSSSGHRSGRPGRCPGGGPGGGPAPPAGRREEAEGTFTPRPRPRSQPGARGQGGADRPSDSRAARRDAPPPPPLRTRLPFNPPPRGWRSEGNRGPAAGPRALGGRGRRRQARVRGGPGLAPS